jgi:plastocyanin
MDSYPMSYESGSSMMGGMLISTYGGGSSSWTMVNQPMDSTSTPMTHNVTVGGSAGLVYSPDSIMANVGDYVIFTFMSENHTATQSNFATPCVKMDGAFDSGFMPNPNNTVNPPPAMKFQVMVSTPLCKLIAPMLH